MQPADDFGSHIIGRLEDGGGAEGEDAADDFLAFEAVEGDAQVMQTILVDSGGLVEGCEHGIASFLRIFGVCEGEFGTFL